VPGRDEGHAGRAEGVRDVEVATADDAEGVADAEAGQRRADQLGDRHGIPYRAVLCRW
jgi:hypothetical protein